MSLLVNLIELIYSPKCKSNFYMAVASLMLIHFWILSTYLIGYLATTPPSPSPITTTSPPPTVSSTTVGSRDSDKYDMFLLNHHHPLWNLIEVVAAILGGIGLAVFFKNLFLIAFESSHLVEADGFGESNQSLEDLRPTGIPQPRDDQYRHQRSSIPIILHPS